MNRLNNAPNPHYDDVSGPLGEQWQDWAIKESG